MVCLTTFGVFFMENVGPMDPMGNIKKGGHNKNDI